MNVKSPLVSVIIPVYNVSAYLCQCIDSVVCQTYRNLEIILVDDGSTDDSGKICDKYAKNDTRIVVIHKKNGGLSDARNTGIRTMCGQYVTFIDSDDYVDRQYIEKLVNIANLYKSDLVIGSYLKVSDSYRQKKRKKIHVKKEEQYTSRRAKLSMLYQKELPMYAHGKLYSSLLFDNIKFPDGRLFEDMLTTWKIMCLVDKTQYIDEPLYFYRQRSDSIVHQKFSHKKMDEVFMAKEILNEVIDDEEMYKASVSRYFFSLCNMYTQVDSAGVSDKCYLEKELKKYLNIVKCDPNNNAAIRLLAFAGSLNLKFIRVLGKLYKSFIFLLLIIFRSI